MNPTSQRLLRRYGWPLGVVVVSFVVPTLGLWVFAVPLVAVWLSWLIAREPRVRRFDQKLPRLAALLPLVALPVVVLLAMYRKQPNDGVALAFLFIYAAPWLAIPVVAGLLAAVSVILQRPAETDLSAQELQ